MHSLLRRDDTLEVYQRNARYALIGVLKLNYENCLALLGDDCFEAKLTLAEDIFSIGRGGCKLVTDLRIVRAFLVIVV